MSKVEGHTTPEAIGEQPDGYLMSSTYTFVPFLMREGSGGSLKWFFDGPVPKVGDAVEMVCYEASNTELHFRWRVRK